MKLFSWLNISAVLFALVAPSVGQLNECDVVVGTGQTSTKCGDCFTLIICVKDLYTFTTKCLPDEYCTDIPNFPGNAVCSLTVPPDCAAFTTTTSAPTTSDLTTTTVITTSSLVDDTTSSPATTTSPDPVQPPDDGSVICSGPGIYPDATNCSIYHYCSALNERSVVQDCPAGYTFYYTTTSTGVFPCKSGAVCDEVTCIDGQLLAPFGSSKVFYAKCVDGVAVMYSCGSGTTFDGEKCVMSCSQEGTFANTANANEYYRCYYSGNTLVSKLQKCPSGKSFDDSRKICV
ncbi:uncharacterized protein LOC129720321 [Wyeomyia smithii]|uniref:uncharacterized protein LOC129720320 n=1 Tax=Wyeomyia smithii TaxID=174621 RepID=UPI002467C812|nr:uncharacterized protein LOC129720320 [Wyeomyia smithii]XP_055527756.1 uncharacterized protein LOC129720321 [Wyeomyia smithii]